MSKVFTITEGLENLGALRTGGQGSVYKARRIGPLITAVKLIPTPIYSENEDDKNYRNFLNEVEKLKRVNQQPNPNVVKILSSGVTESGSFPYIEMEYIEGPDLEELLKPPHDKIFTIKEVIKVADQLACALSHCHNVGVRHGDIKSNNVKFNIHSGNYVLLDFGLAVMSDEQRRTSLRNAGAIEFMAPEQNEGRMLFQTDVYSYGIILFELLAGRVPFPLNDNGENARNNVRLQHIEQPVPNLLALRKENMPESWPEDKKAMEMQVPDWLIALINKCLAKKPEQRYADGMALHEAINEHSISGGTNAELQAENDRLRALLYDPVAKSKAQAEASRAFAAEEQQAPSSDMVQISKPLFVVMMILLVGFMGIAGYYTLFYHNGKTPENTGQFADTLTGKNDTTIHTSSGEQDNNTSSENTVPVQPKTDTPQVNREIKPKVPETIPDTTQTDTSNSNPDQQ
ncbi:serine/threonine protein kinase [Mucilaginibacter sp. RS28]|uniref:Serine/threonine protein kinase n=1 Tax=Mucilaginibacter straminoryzae TaxID=2932774 RepID=A0A9X2BAR2_9SPHI|nr:serine/threonine-protein kinase [Mucilaginibacter straminoryzae]MCJ8211035.1 serine/threonine protein kinase [Mucilaginibacter straminoryzae]